MNVRGISEVRDALLT